MPDAEQPSAPEPAPAPGEERYDDGAHGEDDDRQRQHGTEQAARQAAAEAFYRLASQQRVDADESGRPDRDGNGEVEAELEQAGTQDAGREARRQPGTRQEAADQDDDQGSPPQPGGCLLDGGVRDPPLEGRQLEGGPAKDPGQPGESQVAAQDADVAGGHGDREVEPALGDEQTRRDAGQVLAQVRGEHEEQEDDQQRRPGEGRQVQVIERQRRSPQPFRFGVGAGRCFAGFDAIQEPVDTGRQVPAAAKQKEVAVRAHPQLAVGHDAVMLQRRGGRHQRILLAVDDEDRYLQGVENPPQRPLVRVVEVARVRAGGRDV